MQDGPLIQREDVTVSLDRDVIEHIVSIAEERGTTLSALVRDILGTFCQAYRSGTDWTSPGGMLRPAEGLGTQPGGKGEETMAGVLSRLFSHDERLRSLEERMSTLELTDGVGWGRSGSSMISPIPSPHQMTLSPALGQIAGVIDSDEPTPAGISEEALVKIGRPVSPIITSVDVNSIGKIRADQDYSQTEAAALLSISPSTIRKYVRDGKLSVRKVGRNNIFRGRDLLVYLQQSR